MKVCLERYSDDGQQTLGKLFVYDDKGHLLLRYHTLELPWKGNKNRVSAIPEGTYKAMRHNSPKFGASFWIKDVPGRSEILIHAGNYYKDTLGCILPGLDLVDINKDGLKDVTQSRKAVNKLLEVLPDKFEIEIINTHINTTMETQLYVVFHQSDLPEGYDYGCTETADEWSKTFVYLNDEQLSEFEDLGLTTAFVGKRPNDRG